MFMLLLSIRNVKAHFACARTASQSACRARQAYAWGSAFTQHFTAEAKQFSGASTRTGVVTARAFYESAAFHEATEVLFMETRTSERFNDALQLPQGKGRRQQLEDDRTVFDFAADTPQGRRQDASVVKRHGVSNETGSGEMTHYTIPLGFLYQASLIEQFVALQGAFRIPAGAAQTKGDLDAFTPYLPC
jgi:hypothetical protein